MQLEVRALEHADASGLAVSIRLFRGIPFGDFATIHHHGGAVVQRNVCSSMLRCRRLFFPLVVGNCAVVYRELCLRPVNSDRALACSGYLPGSLDAAGVHHQFAADVDGRRESIAFDDIVVLRTRIDNKPLAVAGTGREREFAAFFHADEAPRECAIIADNLGATTPWGHFRAHQFDVGTFGNDHGFRQKRFNTVADLDPSRCRSCLGDELLELILLAEEGNPLCVTLQHLPLRLLRSPHRCRRDANCSRENQH